MYIKKKKNYIKSKKIKFTSNKPKDLTFFDSKLDLFNKFEYIPKTPIHKKPEIKRIKNKIFKYNNKSFNWFNQKKIDIFPIFKNNFLYKKNIIKLHN